MRILKYEGLILFKLKNETFWAIRKYTEINWRCNPAQCKVLELKIPKNCGNNEIWKGCATRCDQKTCDNLVDGLTCGKQVLESKCICKSGFYRKDGDCVPISECYNLGWRLLYSQTLPDKKFMNDCSSNDCSFRIDKDNFINFAELDHLEAFEFKLVWDNYASLRWIQGRVLYFSSLYS